MDYAWVDSFTKKASEEEQNMKIKNIATLPSVQWGARPEGTWGVTTRNPELKEEKQFQEDYKRALGNRS